MLSCDDSRISLAFTPASAMYLREAMTCCNTCAGPPLFDIAAACAYLATALQPWIAAILFVTLASYIPLTVYLTEWRGRFRRWAQLLSTPLLLRITIRL